VRFSRAAYYRQGESRVERDAAVIEALRRLVDRHPKIGYWKCVDRLRRRGHPWNPKRIHRVYRALGLNQARRTKRRIPTRLRQPLAAPQELNAIWAMDFMSDAFYGGRKFRVLNAIDEGNREVLAIEPATSIPTARVLRVLDELVQP
jgi:putative transposase